MAGELTYSRLLNYLRILEADDSPMLDLPVQVKDDDTGEITHTACVMVTHRAPHQPYLLTCADPQELDDEDTEDWDGPGNRSPYNEHRGGV